MLAVFFPFKNPMAVLLKLGITFAENDSIQFLPILVDFVATNLFRIVVEPRSSQAPGSQLQPRGMLMRNTNNH